jgi:hypothetical protein
MISMNRPAFSYLPFSTRCAPFRFMKREKIRNLERTTWKLVRLFLALRCKNNRSELRVLKGQILLHILKWRGYIKAYTMRINRIRLHELEFR